MAATVRPPTSSSPVQNIPNISQAFAQVELADGFIYKDRTRSQFLQAKCLDRMQISCVTDGNVAGAWKHREAFLEKTVGDIVANCPRGEKLVVISLGSSRLLMEYLIGKALIAQGFEDISFLLIDPLYVCAQGEEKNLQVLLKQFRGLIEQDYTAAFKRVFPRENIKYLSSARKVETYFPQGAYVALIQSLPPYGADLARLKQCHILDKKREDLLEGMVVPATHANAIAFFPKVMIPEIAKKGVVVGDTLPDGIFSSSKTRAYHYFRWGCRLQSSGACHLIFSGGEECLGTNNEEITGAQLASGVRDVVEKAIGEELSRGYLTQAQMTALLEKVYKVAMDYFPGQLEGFFLADYVADQEDLFSFLSFHAGHPYRKVFTLSQEFAGQGYMKTEEIRDRKEVLQGPIPLAPVEKRGSACGWLWSKLGAWLKWKTSY